MNITHSGTGFWRGIRALCLLLPLALLTACTPLYRNHGYVPSDAELAAVKVGVDTRETVAESIGTPSSTGVLKETGYFYVWKRVRTYAYQEPQIIDRQVVSISFDSRGVVSNIERFTLQDGRVVALSRRVTDSNIEGVTFVRQLLGSIGSFSANNLFDG